MKKIIVLITLFVSLSACKNDQKPIQLPGFTSSLGPANNVRLLPTRTRGDPFRCYDQSLCYAGGERPYLQFTFGVPLRTHRVLVFISTVIND